MIITLNLFWTVGIVRNKFLGCLRAFPGDDREGLWGTRSKVPGSPWGVTLDSLSPLNLYHYFLKKMAVRILSRSLSRKSFWGSSHYFVSQKHVLFSYSMICTSRIFRLFCYRLGLQFNLKPVEKAFSVVPLLLVFFFFVFSSSSCNFSTSRYFVNYIGCKSDHNL